MKKTIGEKIKELRKSLKLSQQEFASSIGFSHSFISLVESGAEDASSRFLLLIKSVYGIDLSEDHGHGTLKEAPVLYGSDIKYKRHKKEIDLLIDVLESDNEAFKKGILGFLESFQAVQQARERQETILAAKKKQHS